MNQITIISQTNKGVQYYPFFSNNFDILDLYSLSFNPAAVSPFMNTTSYIAGDQNSPYLIIELWDYESNTKWPNSWAIYDITGKLVKSKFNKFNIINNSFNVFKIRERTWLERYWLLFLLLVIILIVAILVILYLIIFKPNFKVLLS